MIILVSKQGLCLYGEQQQVLLEVRCIWFSYTLGFFVYGKIVCKLLDKIWRICGLKSAAMTKSLKRKLEELQDCHLQVQEENKELRKLVQRWKLRMKHSKVKYFLLNLLLLV